MKAVIEYTASDVAGVKISVGSLKLGIWHDVADLTSIVTSNPEQFTKTPFFMKVDHVLADASWLRLFLSSFHFLEIEEILIQGVTLYLEVNKGKKNVDVILAHMENDNLVRWAGHKLEPVYKQYKYMIDRIRIKDMQVHVFTEGSQSTSATVMPFVVSDIGVKENGVYLGDLVGQTVRAITDAALGHADIQTVIAQPSLRIGN